MVIPPELLAELASADRVVVLTGAGVSAESGVPTFRDAQTGLWANFKPEELATPGAFRRNPKLVWDWYAWRRELVAKGASRRSPAAAVARLAICTTMISFLAGIAATGCYNDATP